MVKHIHVPIPNQRSEFATSHVIKEGAVRTALTLQSLASECNDAARIETMSESTRRLLKTLKSDTSHPKIVVFAPTVEVGVSLATALDETLPKGFRAQGRPDGKGGYLVTLDRQVLDRLKAMRGRGESYSDVILGLAKG